MPDASTLLLFVGASVALLVVPGPAVVYVVTRSVDQGRRAGIVSVLGIETGTLVHALAAAVGLSALIASSATAFTVVKYAGAAYLVYLGVRKLLQREQPDEERLPSADARLFLEGVVIQLLNPKVAIFFLAFLPQFVDPARGAIALQTLVLGTLFTLLAVMSDGAYALFAGAAGRWLGAGRGSRRWLARSSGGVYVALGATAALSGSRST
ncbi:MAG: LysE family translocator [Actinomycetota bacterium]|nr:LysE family translocator [Actinomycetota bacterium]